MRINSLLFSLVFMVCLVTFVPVQGQHLQQLVGLWKATEQAEEDTYVVRDSDTIRYKGRPAYTVTLGFQSDNRGFLQWGDSAKAQFFTYRLINSKLIELKYADRKTWRCTLTIIGSKLFLGEYPIPKKPQESIDLLYTLAFIKQP